MRRNSLMIWRPRRTGDIARWPGEAVRRAGATIAMRLFGARTTPVAPHLMGLAEPTLAGAPTPSPPPRVTIIVLNRNGATLLEKLFSSLQRVNRYPNFDIMLVDHASSDSSFAVADKWRQSLPLTIVRCMENHSFSYSCNRAAERAAGEFVMFLNNDVVMTEDIIGVMVDRAARERSVVGCRLMTLRRGEHTVPSVQHMGVRFFWNVRRGLPSPRNAVPAPGDERLAASPAKFFAVTAALCVCRRDDYFAVGGMYEEYVYGQEDVDLCLKFSLRLDRPTISLNNISAFHSHGVTRKAQIAQPAASDRLERNLAVYNRRFGYAVRRTILPRLFTDDGSLWGRRARVEFVLGKGHEGIRGAFGALCLRNGWEILNGRGFSSKGVDLLIVADPNYRIEGARDRSPMLSSIAWAVDNGPAWITQDLTEYDLLLAGDALIAADLSECGRPVTAVLDTTAPDAAETLFAGFVDYLTSCHRFCIRQVAGADAAFTTTLAVALRLAGHRVRIDSPEHWNTARGMGDDIVVLLPGAPTGPPLDGKISVACGDAAPEAAVDARLPMADPTRLAADVLATVQRLHASRLRGPQDTPLVALTPFARGDIVAGWANG